MLTRPSEIDFEEEFHDEFFATGTCKIDELRGTLLYYFPNDDGQKNHMTVFVEVPSDQGLELFEKMSNEVVDKWGTNTRDMFTDANFSETEYDGSVDDIISMKTDIHYGKIWDKDSKRATLYMYRFSGNICLMLSFYEYVPSDM